MGNGPQPFEYFYLISNVYILFIFCFHYYRNRHWFLRTYIIGKSLQLAAILLLQTSKFFLFTGQMEVASMFLIAGFPFEIFGIISYDGRSNNKTFNVFLYATILFCLINMVMIFMNLEPAMIWIGSIFFYNYGGIVLLSRKDKSRFRYLIGVVFIAFSLFSAIFTLIDLFHFAYPPDMPPPGDMMPPNNNILESYKTIMESYNGMIYFVMLVSSIGYLVILKEQDEVALEIANTKISKENITLKKLDEEKNKFFSIIAHDLRGPIGTLAGLTEMLIESKERQETGEYEKELDLINLTATRTYTLLNNLLQWARSESGALTPHPEMIDMNGMTDEVVRLMQPFAMGKNIQLTNTGADNIKAFADPEMMRTVIRNLISNAIKFTNSGGNIRVDIKQTNIPVISVTDNGLGMSSEIQNKLFALDSNYTTPGTNKEEGSGIGLKLSHEFVIKNNGKIWVESTLGVGTTFYVSLPATGGKR
jgi:two-component system, sensor histidine kinase and response regulator